MILPGLRPMIISGGVGGAKLALGLSRIMPHEDLLVVVNTGDDFEHLGLSISPDIDTVAYTLAGLANRELGWGRHDETWSFMETMEALGGQTWFRLGDRDMALHVERTRRLKAGESLSAVTADLCRRMGVGPAVVPMTDDPVRTRLLTDLGWLDFQEYFVHRRCEPVVSQLQFQGAGAAKTASRFHRGIGRSGAGGGGDLSIQPVHQRGADPGYSRREGRVDGLQGPDHCRFADYRGAGGQGADGEDDDGTGARSVGRYGCAAIC